MKYRQNEIEARAAQVRKLLETTGTAFTDKVDCPQHAFRFIPKGAIVWSDDAYGIKAADGLVYGLVGTRVTRLDFEGQVAWSVIQDISDEALTAIADLALVARRHVFTEHSGLMWAVAISSGQLKATGTESH